MIWWCFPLAELLSLVLCVIFFVRINRKLIRPLGASEKRGKRLQKSAAEV